MKETPYKLYTSEFIYVIIYVNYKIFFILLDSIVSGIQSKDHPHPGNFC